MVNDDGIIIIEKILEDKKKWRNELNKHYDLLLERFEDEEVRHSEIEFSFSEKDPMIHVLKITHFVVNLMLWRGFVELKPKKMDERYILNCDNITSKDISNYINKFIVKSFKKKYPNRFINLQIAKVIEELKVISKDFNMIIGLNYNLKDTAELAMRNEKYDELIHTRLPSKMQPSETEEFLADKTKELVNILKNEPNNLSPFLNSGEGIKVKQLCEFELNIGTTPTIDGGTYPVPVDTNFLVYGIDSVASYYLESTKGRISSIMNKKYVGNSGYFARKLGLITSDTMLDLNPAYDCGTRNPIRFEVKDENYLKLIDGRYYSMGYRDIVERCIDSNKDFDLIGKKILLRSPVTCCGHTEGRGVCYKCYGDLSYTNNDIHIGQFASQNLTAPLTQRILSAKHLLTTNSEKLEWSEGFDELFIVEGNVIQLNPSINTNNYFIIIDLEDVETENEMDDIEFNHTISYFKIGHQRSKRSPINILYEIRENNDNKLYLSGFIDKMIKKNKQPGDTEVKISMAKVDFETPLFYLNIINNELSKPLKDIMGLIDTKKNLMLNIDDMVQTFAKLIIQSEIGIQLVHAETIIRNIIRNKNDILAYPDYRQRGVEYQILTVSSALKHNPSVVISMSFERLKEQVHNALTYKKTGTSFLDTMYID